MVRCSELQKEQWTAIRLAGHLAGCLGKTTEQLSGQTIGTQTAQLSGQTMGIQTALMSGQMTADQ